MDRDPVVDVLEQLERPVRPRAEFADALLDDLLAELERRPALPVRPTRRREISPRVRRIALAAAALAAALAVIAIALVPFRGLVERRRPTAPFTERTPFTATIQGSFENPGNVLGCCWTEEPAGSFTAEISYRGPDAWRIDLVETDTVTPLINANIGLSGGFAVWDGRALRSYDAETDTYFEQLHAEGFSPLNLLGFTEGTSGWEETCSRGERLADEVIVERPVRHYRCPTSGSFGDFVDLWVDADTGLILRLRSHLPDVLGDPTPVEGPINFIPGEVIEVATLEYAPAFPEGTFTFEPPEGAKSNEAEEARRPPTSLTIGEKAPSWDGVLLEGGSLSLSSLRGKPTLVYFWGTWCPPCTGAALDAVHEAFRERAQELNVVTIGHADEPEPLRAFLSGRGYDLPVVVSADGAIAEAWGIEGVPTFVLLDPDGRFVGAYVGFIDEIGTGADVQAVLDALVAGGDLPHIDAFPREQID